MVPLGFVVCCYLYLVYLCVDLGQLHPLESLVPLPSDVLCSDLCGEVYHYDLEGSGEVLFCAPFGGSHAEAGMFGAMGEGLEAVVVGHTVEQISSSPGFGEPDSVWDLDDLP